MGGARLGFLPIVAALSCVGASAFAADYPQPQCYDYSIIAAGRAPPGAVPCYVPPPPVVIEEFSGWYLRGDLGYRWGLITGAQSAPGFASPTDSRLGSALSGTLGVGIKSDWLRTDVTVDFASPQKYSGTIAVPSDVTAKIQTTSVLFNGYLDLGTWYGFTPYLGAGAGGSYVRVSDYSSLLAPPFGTTAVNNQWNFTYAGRAGVGWQVAPNLMLDLGYRYLNFGDVKTASDAFGAMTFKNVASHEVRIGLRWSFDDFRRVR